MDRFAAIPERHATFREEKRLAALDYPLTSQGRLVWQRPAHLEKITTSPEPESLVVDGNRLTLTAGGEAPRSLDLDARPEVVALVDAVRGPLSGDLALLERHYRIAAAGDRASWHLTLLPTDPGVQRLLRDIAIAGTDTDIRTIRIAQTNGDEETMAIGPAP
jgi:hypothetical protein